MKRSKREELFFKRALKEKLITAEEKVSFLRLLVVLFNSAVYLAMVDKSATIPWLAYTVIAVAFLYSLYTVFLKPYRHYPVMLSSYFTSVSDAMLISLWIAATGGLNSPFYVLWYISIIAIAFRYTVYVTVIVSLLYSALYLGVLLFQNTQSVFSTEVFIRTGYIFLIGLLGGLFSKDSLENIKDRLKVRNSEKALLKARMELENKVKERTSELARSNELLKEEVAVRKKAEEKQAAMLQELEKSNSELESFAYIVSHDLKAPLRAIASISDWLSEDLADKINEDSREQLALIKNRVGRLRDLIDGILRFSKVGRVPEEKEIIAAEQLVKEVLDILCVPDNIKIEIGSSLPHILFEKTLLTQVFQNLLSNAIKYIDKPQGIIRINAEQEGSAVTFSVCDNGPGIEERHHEKIFQIFQTINARDEVESTGVGLTIVKKIIENAGGKIWLKSTPGQGTCFYFSVNAVVGNPSLHPS